MAKRNEKTLPSKKGSGNPLGSLSSALNTQLFLVIKMIICVFGIYGCFGVWAHKQERIVTFPYRFVETASDGWRAREVVVEEYFPGIWSLAFCQCVTGFALAACGLILLRLYKKILGKKEKTHSEVSPASSSSSLTSKKSGKTGKKWNPVSHFISHLVSSAQRIWKPFAVLCFSNAFGSTIGYSAMRLVPYPVFLTAKMGKTFPLMFVGYFFLGNRFPRSRVILCTVLTFAIYAFYALSPTSRGKDVQTRKSEKPTGETDWVASHTGEVGMFLLLCNLIMDGVTNATQDAFLRSQKRRWNGLQLMCVVNLGSALWLFLAMCLAELPLQPSTPNADFSASSSSSLFSLSQLWPSHDASRTLLFFQRHPQAARDVAILSIVNGVGQFFIFFTIILFGTLTLTVVTLVRKAGSVGVSILLHGHPVEPSQGVALLVALLCAFWDSAFSIKTASSQKKMNNVVSGKNHTKRIVESRRAEVEGKANGEASMATRTAVPPQAKHRTPQQTSVHQKLGVPEKVDTMTRRGEGEQDSGGSSTPSTIPPKRAFPRPGPTPSHKEPTLGSPSVVPSSSEGTSTLRRHQENEVSSPLGNRSKQEQLKVKTRVAETVKAEKPSSSPSTPLQHWEKISPSPAVNANAKEKKSKRRRY